MVKRRRCSLREQDEATGTSSRGTSYKEVQQDEEDEEEEEEAPRIHMSEAAAEQRRKTRKGHSPSRQGRRWDPITSSRSRRSIASNYIPLLSSLSHRTVTYFVWHAKPYVLAGNPRRARCTRCTASRQRRDCRRRRRRGEGAAALVRLHTCATARSDSTRAHASQVT